VPREIIQVARPIAGELHRVYDLTDHPSLWRPGDALVKTYRRAVTRRLGPRLTPRDLLQCQLKVYGRIPGPFAHRDASNIRFALAKGRRFRKASCLEVRLWLEQHRRYPMLRHPTEFGAFVLRRGSRVRVYWSAADRLGQKMRGAVTRRVAADVKAGYRLLAHLHNHPFLPDRVVGDRLYTTRATKADVGGALAPSATDVQLYRNFRRSLRLEAAWITNGFDTAEYSYQTFDKLSGTPNPKP